MIPTFTPPTYNLNIPDRREETQGAANDNMFWGHYGKAIPTGYSVLITGGVATASPGTITPTAGDIADSDSGSGEGGKAWFRGGNVYTVTSAEQTILEAAGYTVSA